MPKFLLEATYTQDGVKGLRSGGGSRRVAAVKEGIESAGGKLEAMYFAFGDVDVYMIVEGPDNASAAAASLTAMATGAVKIKTVVLLSPEEIDAAVKMPSKYTPPGG